MFMASRARVSFLLVLAMVYEGAADLSCGPLAKGLVSCGPKSEIEMEMQLAAQRGAQYLQRKQMEAMGTKGHSLMQQGSSPRRKAIVDESGPGENLPSGLHMPTSFNPFIVGDLS